MGGGYSASASSSATSGNKTSIGPVTFGGVGFGNQGNAAGGHTTLYLIGAALAAALAFFLIRKHA